MEIKTSLVALLAAIVIGLVACSQHEQLEAKVIKPMQLITERGLYELETARLTLRVFEDGHGRTDYTLTDASGEVLLQAKRKFNPSQQWGVAFDAMQRLWVHSSDVGTVIWEKNASGVYTDKVVSQKEAKDMPQPLYDSLPRVLRRKWEASRP